ncbi:5-formyltetrahydrofolate cyclo-ligase [Desulfopila aestuarii]|uniref:5-formyltetrahydrofolate cyclo-ligase n=1 Tax=Desulfopila aestuarii DSM 18488 TaxID=1121416 RepID=A0A1M7Y3M4_9BACT|nr:5-formyltetrahydrofolate cyclo-ligase [Desulfopila aestuarii]SHO46799.1 5-formyltetrahydrofolate cyclo-ligase [Desulfopila aestuarii DSM 18488]
MIHPKQLRKDILKSRDGLSAEEIREKSGVICKQLLALPEIQRSTNIFLYVSFRSEVATTDLLERLLAAGKTVSVPITYVKAPRIDAIRITNPARDLVPGYCDIPEPRQEILASNYVAPESIDAIILPGSVFDLRCGRFGYGGGFYDRFVSSAPSAVRIGLAFDLQIVERAPLQDHDELLDMVITESRIIRGDR